MNITKNIKKKFLNWRKKIIFTNFISYILYCFIRKSFIFIVPILSENLKLKNSEIGLLSTCSYIIYGISKVINSFLADLTNPKYFASFGLFISGILNFCIIYCNSYNQLIILYCLCGWFQGFGWPTLTKQLTCLLNSKERNIWWSICSSAHTIGGALAAIVCTHITYLLNWHFALFIPSISSFCFSIFMIKYLNNLPLITINYFYTKKNNIKKNIIKKQQIYYNQLIKNKLLWLFALCYCTTYILKIVFNDWTILFLIEKKKYTLITAGICIFSFEIGGIIGTILTGFIINFNFFKKKKLKLLIIYYFLLSLFIYLLHSNIKILYINVFILTIIGFTTFSPQMLIGLLVTELTNKKIVCAANGFISMWAYIGASIAGYPFGLLADKSWEMFFLVLQLCSIFSIIPILSISIHKKFNF